jgi:dolichol-phosphate mannosyltransferase
MTGRDADDAHTSKLIRRAQELDLDISRPDLADGLRDVRRRAEGIRETGADPHPEGYPGVGRVLVLIPTYNEAENVTDVVARVRAAVPSVEIMILDDNSPDDTGQVADEIAAADPAVHVMRRPGKQGLGAAYIAGFRWALDRGYDGVVEMDADGSHAPEELPRLLELLADADVVFGSRWVRGGRVVNWPLHRRILSRGANLYTRLALGVPIRDATGGYRAFRTLVLEKLEVDTASAQGYAFQVELALRAYRSGCRVVEVPITFTERSGGGNGMSGSVVREAVWRVTAWGVRARLAAVSRLIGARRKRR